MKKLIETFWELLKSRGIVSLIDSAFWRLISFFRRYLYSWTGANYKLKEAIFWPKYIDYWLRNSWALAHILEKSQNDEILVLDIGSGEGGILEILNSVRRKRGKFKLIVSDYDWKKLTRNKNRYFLGGKVVADAAFLPFKSHSFDFSLSIDLIEHLSAQDRDNFFKEIHRVSKKGFLIHCPLVRENGQFQANVYDSLFQREHLKRFRKEEPFTEQHLNIEYPTYEEIANAYPNVIIEGDQNAGIWLKYMITYRRPLIGYFCGFYYILKWKSKNRTEPYYSSFIYYKIE